MRWELSRAGEPNKTRAIDVGQVEGDRNPAMRCASATSCSATRCGGTESSTWIASRDSGPSRPSCPAGRRPSNWVVSAPSALPDGAVAERPLLGCPAALPHCGDGLAASCWARSDGLTKIAARWKVAIDRRAAHSCRVRDSCSSSGDHAPAPRGPRQGSLLGCASRHFSAACWISSSVRTSGPSRTTGGGDWCAHFHPALRTGGVLPRAQPITVGHIMSNLAH